MGMCSNLQPIAVSNQTVRLSRINFRMCLQQQKELYLSWWQQQFGATNSQEARCASIVIIKLWWIVFGKGTARTNTWSTCWGVCFFLDAHFVFTATVRRIPGIGNTQADVLSHNNHAKFAVLASQSCYTASDVSQEVVRGLVTRAPWMSANWETRFSTNCKHH